MNEDTVFTYCKKMLMLSRADHKVLNEENDSRLQHRYAAVVQDSSFLFDPKSPNEKKTAQETMNSLRKFLPPDQEPGTIHTLRLF